MKFRALVVAAMVITSVNAKWYDIFLNCFGKNRASNSGERERLLPNNETPVQYSEATRNRGGYGLHDSDNSEDSDDSDDEEDNIYERPACDSMLATLRGLQDDISRLSREHSDGLSALCELKDGESHWKDWGLGSRFTSRDISKAELEHTKKKVDVLKERYTGVLEEFLSIGCSTKVHNPMSLEEVDDLKKFLSNLVESSDCGDEQETSV